MDGKHKDCIGNKELLAFARKLPKDRRSKEIFFHLLECRACRKALMRLSPAAEQEQAAALIAGLLVKYMREDSVFAWRELSGRLESAVREQLTFESGLFDVIAAVSAERESIFFRSLAVKDSSYYWMAEMEIPHPPESRIRFRVRGAGNRPLAAGTFILCGLEAGIADGECGIELLEFQKNLHRKSIGVKFPDGHVSDGVALFFYEPGIPPEE